MAACLCRTCPEYLASGTAESVCQRGLRTEKWRHGLELPARYVSQTALGPDGDGRARVADWLRECRRHAPGPRIRSAKRNGGSSCDRIRPRPDRAAVFNGEYAAVIDWSRTWCGAGVALGSFSAGNFVDRPWSGCAGPDSEWACAWIHRRRCTGDSTFIRNRPGVAYHRSRTFGSFEGRCENDFTIAASTCTGDATGRSLTRIARRCRPLRTNA